MKNIDIIIKYLSGDMLPDQNDKFREEISINTELRNEFEFISSIWEEIQKQLQLKDGPDSKDRELLIAEILAEHDIHFYGTSADTKREIAFRKKLSQSMYENEKSEKQNRKLTPRIYSVISLMAAAMVAALVIILNPAPDLNELIDAYYRPVSDPVFEKVNGTTRSNMSSAMALFKQGNYKESSSLAYEEMKNNPEALEIQLLFALASYEAGDFSEAESQLLSLIEKDKKEIAEAANWYLSLLYIKTSNGKKSKSHLENLTSRENAYQKRAHKLVKLMD